MAIAKRGSEAVIREPLHPLTLADQIRRSANESSMMDPVSQTGRAPDRFLRRIDPRRSFGPRIALGTLILTIAGMAVVAFVGATTAARRIEERVGDTLHAVADETVGGHIEYELGDKLGDLGELSSELTYDLPQRHEVLATYLLVNREVDWVAIYDATGTAVDFAGPSFHVRNLSTFEWFQAGREGPAVRSDPDTKEIIIASPWRHSRDGRGVIAIGVGARWLQSIDVQVSELLRAHGSSKLAIADNHGKPILGSPVLAALSPNGRTDRAYPGIASDSQHYLIAIRRLNAEAISGLGWSVVLAEPLDVALEPARNVQATIFRWGLAVSAVLAVFTWLLAVGIVSPLRKLAQFAEHGSASGPAEIPFTEQQDEIGVLSTAWRDMLVRLADDKAQMATVNSELTHALSSRTAFARELEQERLRSDALLNSLPGMAYRCSDDAWRTLSFASAGAAEILGRSAAELANDVECRLNDLIAPEDRQQVIERLNEAIATQQSYDVVYRLRTVAGTYVSVWDRGRVVTTDDPPRSFLTGFLTDVSELHSLRSELDQANRLATLGHLVAVTSHELNNVLMSIQPSADLIGQIGESSEAKAAARQITEAVRRGKHITSEVLRFTRPAAPVLEHIEIGAWLSDFLGSVRGSLGGVTTEVHDSNDRSHLRIDPSQLHQILLNLLLNAKDAVPDQDGRITISLSHVQMEHGADASDRTLRIDVTDNGSGMTPETLSRIFDPLFTTKRKGTGLGLAVVRQLVGANAGRIDVRSTPGAGTTFSLFFPLVGPEIQPKAQKDDVALPPGIKVLLVDDEPAILSGMAVLLELHGFDVTMAASGREMFLALERKVPDVIILDVGLPDVDGVDAYRRVAAGHPSLPVVFSTGRLTDVRLENLPPATRVLVKPYDIDTLLRTLSGLLMRLRRAQ